MVVAHLSYRDGIVILSFHHTITSLFLIFLNMPNTKVIVEHINLKKSSEDINFQTTRTRFCNDFPTYQRQTDRLISDHFLWRHAILLIYRGHTYPRIILQLRKCAERANCVPRHTRVPLDVVEDRTGWAWKRWHFCGTPNELLSQMEGYDTLAVHPFNVSASHVCFLHSSAHRQIYLLNGNVLCSTFSVLGWLF